MKTKTPFRDRRDAGRVLSSELSDYANRTDVVVLALPRGGIPVAFELARALGAPMDVHLARKLGVPGEPEVAMGAIAEGGHAVLKQQLIRDMGIPREEIEDTAVNEWIELDRRRTMYRQGRSRVPLAGKVAILVDDGLATGSTALAAVRDLRDLNTQKIVVAAPVADAYACREIEKEADEVTCAMIPTPFQAVGNWYHDFSQTSDEEALDLLQRAQLS